MKLPGKVYDVLKFIVWIWVPLATLAVTVLEVWIPNNPIIEPIRQTLIAIEVFLGAVVAKSNYDYNKGSGDDELD